MENPIKLSEKYDRNGWPSVRRPDLKPPEGWSLSLLCSLKRIRTHSLSPDGDMIAYIKDGESLSDVYMIPSSGGWASRISFDRALVPYWDDDIPQWSQDSQWIAFGIRGHVNVVPRSGGLPKKITDFTASASGPRWMPDSIGIIVSVERDETDQLLLTDRTGSWPRALTTDPLGDHWDPMPSPDGKSIIYTLRRFDDLKRLDVILLELDSSKSTTLYGKPSVRATSARWSPDGKWIAFISQESGFDEIHLIEPNGEGLHQLTKARQEIAQFAWSPDSNQIVAIVMRNGAFDMILVETETGQVSDLRSGLGVHSNPNWSADRSFITFEYESPLSPPDLYRLELANKQIRQLTFSNPPALQKNRMVIPERVTYKSTDGLEIPAFLYKPIKSNGAAIVYPHGGPNDHAGFFGDELAQYFVAKGYTWLMPNYRGSIGYGRDFERAIYDKWGAGDLQDCLQGARYLRGVDSVKLDRIGIMGGSYGGYLTACALARDPEYLFACGVMKYGDSNLVSSWAQCERRLRLYTELHLGHPAVNRTAYLKGSPIAEVQNVRKPMLILHGLLDTIVPPEASEEWVEALKRYQKIFEYKTYDDEPHGFLRRENLYDAYERIERFLDWCLLSK
jgi:dipeptidyl aminopeptidase/acylaminoacyl peptidase